MRKFVLLAVIVIGLWQYQQERRLPFAVLETSPAAPAPSVQFTCDGRQHCSQMRSRAEAEFFVSNCPNTKMDGDYDGEPCENETRF